MKEVTDDEHVHDDSRSKELPELVENIIKSDSMTTMMTTTIDKLFADGGASMKAMRFFRYLWDNGVALLYQSKKKNAKVRWKKGDILMNLSVLAQKKDLQKWKEDSSVRYDGQRGGL
jgi:hypothetical protein